MQTFVVRLFRAACGDATADRTLRGVVDDIASGSQTPFGDAEQLLRILGDAAPRSSRTVDTSPRQDRSTSHSFTRRIP